MTFRYGIDHLNLDIVNGIADGSIKAELCQQALDKINASRQNVEVMANSDEAVYGINTGFGRYVILRFRPKKPTCCRKTC